MSSVSKNISLAPEVIKLYKEISQKSEISIDELKKITKLDHGKLEYLLGSLTTHNLVERIIEVKKKILLTEAGKTAAANQLVERRILAILKDHSPVSSSELSKLIDCDNRELNAGIGYLKKQGLIDIVQGQISFSQKDIDVSKDIQDILVDLSKGNKVDIQNYEKNLLQRNLIAIEDEKEIIIRTLVKFEEMEKNLVEIFDISRLTPEMIRNGTWRETKLRKYNLEVSPPDFFTGRKQPYARFLDEVKQKLIAYGFQEMRGPIVELEYWNFDALFQAQDHPAREWSDVYRIAKPNKGKLPKGEHVKNVQMAHENGYNTGSKGWRYKWDPMKSARLVLRAQGTSVSARTLVDLPIPSKYFSISRCFRPDTTDATHLSEFNQAEGIVCDPSITFRDLLGILETFAIEISEAPNFTFKPDYYPFTEPSVELSVKDPKIGHIEYGGAGIFRPEVTKPFGIDAPVIAWGLGVDRLFMVKYGITDIRELYSHKLDWLRSARMT